MEPLTERYARPLSFLFLMLPFGTALGFVTVTLPFVLTRAGVSVEATAGLVAVASLPNTWRFVLSPVTDLTLTLRRWYLLAVVASAAALVFLSATPIRPSTLAWVTMLALLAQLAANMTSIPAAGLMAHTVREEQKGRAAGWYQAGNVGGVGLGGGAGIWLASHATLALAGIVLAAASLACAVAIFLVPDATGATPGQQVVGRLREMGRDFRELLRSRFTRVVVFLVLTPIGVGAATGLWSAIGPDWRASADLVALTTGLLAGLVAVVGSVAGGWAADRIGRWWAYLGSGALLCVIGVVMAAAPRAPSTFGTGVLLYACVQASNNAAFSALLLHAIGRGAASTKYALLSSAGNVPVIYMTAFDGWAHDRWGPGGMLIAEAALAAVCIVLVLPAIAWVEARRHREHHESAAATS